MAFKYCHQRILLMACKNKCINHKAHTRPAIGRYAAGQSRCPTCFIFLLPEGVYEDGKCKCCNSIVRTKPRLSKFSRKTRENLAALEKGEIKVEDLENSKSKKIIEISS